MESEVQVVRATCRKEEEDTKTGTRTRKNCGEPIENIIDDKAANKEGGPARERRTEKGAGRRGRPTNAERLQRSRAGSLGSILELYGRKREREIDEGEEGKEKSTRKYLNSATVQLSPITKHKEEEGQSMQGKMDIGKLKGMTDVREMLIYLVSCMNTENNTLRIRETS